MNQFAALAEPARLRIVEELARSERSAGELGAIVETEYGLSQPATSRHLRVLREADLVHSRVDGTRRIYALNRQRIEQISDWTEQLRALWETSLSALEVEIVRGKRDRRHQE